MKEIVGHKELESKWYSSDAYELSPNSNGVNRVLGFF